MARRTRTWERSSWEYDPEDLLPASTPTGSDKVQLILTDALSLWVTSITSPVLICMHRHLIQICHYSPASLALDWCAVGSFEVLPVLHKLVIWRRASETELSGSLHSRDRCKPRTCTGSVCCSCVLIGTILAGIVLVEWARKQSAWPTIVALRRFLPPPLTIVISGRRRISILHLPLSKTLRHTSHIIRILRLIRRACGM